MVDENFVVRIPDSLGLDVAAPLLCAGVTTYSALRRNGAGEGTGVGGVGLGGLGHLAVKIAHAMGARVTVLSRSLAKRDRGLALGADDHRALADPATLAELAGGLDLLVNTVSADLDVNDLMGLLGAGGVLAYVGVPENPISVPVLAMEDRGLTITGSSIGGIRETEEMLAFCAGHGIGADVEVIAPHQINEAYERMLASDVYFRFVIDMTAL
ncbi:zinc-binding dehydrogenase [Actinomadura roseirufa]|uniref:zinc-binding dehydrogenase n=1 Tax=Actinomadura roseirufa TaxID=2094049 RepID=UPI001A955BF1|nr:zinc-binding dehydrogenase [Actinomadura roseirufa]